MQLHLTILQNIVQLKERNIKIICMPSYSNSVIPHAQWIVLKYFLYNWACIILMSQDNIENLCIQ
jgi:hypothetical protein